MNLQIVSPVLLERQSPSGTSVQEIMEKRPSESSILRKKHYHFAVVL